MVSSQPPDFWCNFLSVVSPSWRRPYRDERLGKTISSFIQFTSAELSVATMGSHDARCRSRWRQQLNNCGNNEHSPFPLGERPRWRGQASRGTQLRNATGSLDLIETTCIRKDRSKASVTSMSVMYCTCTAHSSHCCLPERTAILNLVVAKRPRRKQM